MSEYIEVGQPLQFTDPNTPTRVGEIVENVSDIYNIPSPRLGMQVFVKNEKKSFVITSLKSKVINGVDVPEAAVEAFEPVGAKAITWNNDTNPSNMNDFVVAGVYDIKGERTRSNDNLPILNTGGGHTFNARLAVLDSSIPGTGKNDDKCITQVLSFSNRLGQGEAYIRTGKGRTLDNLSWENWSTLQRNVNVGTITSLDHLVDNGIYSGVYVKNVAEIETFVMVVINNYAAASQTGMPKSISQFKYSVSLGGSFAKYETRVGTGVNDWGDWEILNNTEINAIKKGLVEQINGETTRAELAEQELLERIQGTSKQSDAAKDPFKFLGTFLNINGSDFKTALDSLHSTSSGEFEGFWRAKVASDIVEIQNIVINYKDDRWLQVLKSMYGYNASTGNFSILDGVRYRIMYREHNNASWGEWVDVEQHIYNSLKTNADNISNEITRARTEENAIRKLISDLVGESPAILDTIHEISSWILNDQTGAAAMATQINENTSTIQLNYQDIVDLQVNKADKSDAMQYNTLGVNVYADKAEIYGRSINTDIRVVEFPAATAQNAGMMSAEDKKNLDDLSQDVAAMAQQIESLGEDIKSKAIAIYSNALNSQTGGNLFDKNSAGILVGKIFADDFGNIKDRDDCNISDYMPVVPGETYSCTQIVRKPSGYDLDKNFKQAIAYSNGIFQIPEGVYWIRMSYVQSWANSWCVNKGTEVLPNKQRTFGLIRTEKLYDAAVTVEKLADNAVTTDKLSEELKERIQSLPAVVKKNGAFVAKGNLSSGDIWELPQNSIEVGEFITFSANIIGTWGALFIGHGKDKGAYMKITSDTITFYSHVVSPMNEKTVEHGLKIENNIQIYIEKIKTAVVSIKLISNGISSETFNYLYWYGNRGKPFVECESGSLSDCSFGWTCKAINSDIWAFGDSYFGVLGTNRWVAYLISDNHTNLVVNGFSGQNSVSAYTDLTNLFTIGTPKKILWCMGMNDKDSSTAVNANWLNTYNSLKTLCEENNIELILATIPTVPSVINKFKNEIIRSSGYRYIDFDKAVGANETTGAWFGDMLYTDGVHPSKTGALALYNRAIADMPELLNC